VAVGISRPAVTDHACDRLGTPSPTAWGRWAPVARRPPALLRLKTISNRAAMQPFIKHTGEQGLALLVKQVDDDLTFSRRRGRQWRVSWVAEKKRRVDNDKTFSDDACRLRCPPSVASLHQEVQ
jgi:hypothetical protein